jgi:hypothetical protein
LFPEENDPADGLLLKYCFTLGRAPTFGKTVEQVALPPMPTSTGVTPAAEGGWTSAELEASAGKTTNSVTDAITASTPSPASPRLLRRYLISSSRFPIPQVPAQARPSGFSGAQRTPVLPGSSSFSLVFRTKICEVLGG